MTTLEMSCYWSCHQCRAVCPECYTWKKFPS